MTIRSISKIAAALGAVIFLAVSAFAQSEPISMPGTLLAMYGESDVIVVATFDRSERAVLVREDEDFRVYSVKKYFDVTAVLKGKKLERVTLADEIFTALEKGEPKVESKSDLNNGDAVLLFLRTDSHGDPALTETGEGMKRLSARDLAIYERRIADLDKIFFSGKANAGDVAEWLVRCAEEPATRWDAAFELVKGFERADYQRRQAEGRNESLPSNDIAGRKFALAELINEPALIAKAVDANQKQALANILFNRIYLPRNQRSRPVQGDRELTELVKRWGDTRLTRLLLDELRNTKASAYRISESINLAASLTDDPCLRRIAANYNSLADKQSRAEAVRDFLAAAERASN